MRLMRIRMPVDANKHLDLAERPVCGVIVTAVAINTRFDDMWEYYREGRSKNWKGSLMISDIINGIKYHGGKLVDVPSLNPRYSGQPLRKLVTHTSLLSDDNVYVVFTNRHVQIIQGNMVIDQQGAVPCGDYWAARRSIISVKQLVNWREFYE
jgi:hypothetical protein